MSKSRKGLCYLCGNRGLVTDDHIPPKCLSPESPRTSFFFAPACRKCNEKLSKEESKLRDFLVTGSAYFGNKSAEIAFEAMKRNFRRNELGNLLIGKNNKDLMRIVTNITLEEVRTKAGIFLGKAFQVKIPEDVDWRSVLVKIARGLQYINKKEVVPNNYCYEALFLKDLLFPDILNKCNIVGTCGDFFAFKGGVPDEDTMSGVWYMSFYGRIAALVIITNPLYTN